MNAGEHLRGLEQSLAGLRARTPRIARWGGMPVRRLSGGARLPAAGNGGSAAEPGT